jgi:HSP20 family protein
MTSPPPGPDLAAPEGAPELWRVGREAAAARRDAIMTGAELWTRSFEPFHAFQASMMRWFDEVWRETTSGLHTAHPGRSFSMAPLLGLPPADVKQTDTAYILSMEVPGLSDGDVNVSIDGEILTVRGHKSQERDEATAAYRLSERRFGRFERNFTLPRDAVPGRFESQIRNGVLKIALPRAREAAPASAEAAARH